MVHSGPLSPAAYGRHERAHVATPQSVRHLNEVRALDVLFREGGMSRAALARALGLNRSSTGNIIANLIAERMVVEDADSRAAREQRSGRPGVTIEIDPDAATFLGAEIGVERLTVVAADLKAREARRQSVAFAAAAHPPEEAIDRLAGMVNAMAERTLDRTRIRGLCVAIPALLDKRGVVRNALILRWQRVPLAALLRERIRLDVPILVENDANAFAVAETYRGTTGRSETVALLLIENGVGGGVVIGGRLFRGSDGFAGEFGQLVIGGEGFFSGPHKPGHLESYVGKDAVLARYHANGAPAAAGLEALLEGLDAGEPVAVRTASEWGDRLARGLIQLTSVLNPGLIVLGGSVAPIFPHVAHEVLDAMRGEFLEGFPVPKVELSALGPEGPALGGALLLHQRMFSVDERMIYPGGEPATLFHG